MNKSKSFLFLLSAAALLCLPVPAYAAPLHSVPQDVLEAAEAGITAPALSEAVDAEEPDNAAEAEDAAEADSSLSGEAAASAVPAEADSSARAAQLVAFASQYIGNPYRYGGASLTGGADCSSFNDRVMLEGVAHGIAMGNAVPAIRDCADYVTDPIGEDGIWNALRHFGWT